MHEVPGPNILSVSFCRSINYTQADNKIIFLNNKLNKNKCLVKKKVLIS